MKSLFCVAPWVHGHKRTDGAYSLCCLTSELKADYSTFDDWWNSEEIRDARKEILDGKVPDVCSACIRTNRKKGENYNLVFHRQYGHLSDTIIRSTQNDGSTTLVPKSIDFRTFYCNLKCRTCDSRHSSSIHTEQLSFGKPTASISKISVDEKVISASVLSEVDSIYWAGGEPFMSPMHAPTMKELIHQGRANAIEVSYSSNLMQIGPKELGLLEEIYASFKALSIAASIDGVGSIGEYIRVGFQERVFFANFRTIRKSFPEIDLCLDVTITNIGLIGLRELLSFACQENAAVNFKLMEVNGENDFLSIDVMEMSAIVSIFEECRGLRLPAVYMKYLNELGKIIARRHEAREFSKIIRSKMEESERVRGQEGFFMRHMGGKLAAIQ